MKSARNLLTGLLTAIATSLIVVGALALALTEGGNWVSPVKVLVNQPQTATMQGQAAGISSTPTLLLVKGITSSPATPLTLTSQLQPTACPQPNGWERYTIQSYDTVADLAKARSISTSRLMNSNCLVMEAVLPGTILYLPPSKPTAPPVDSPTHTNTVTPSAIPLVNCGAPYAWVRYVVRSDDTLFSLSVDFRTSVAELQFGNCLGNSTLIFTGQSLYVPYVPTRTPTHTLTAAPNYVATTQAAIHRTQTAAARVVATQTAQALTQKAYQTKTPTVIQTQTQAVTATQTPTNLPTPTATPTTLPPTTGYNLQPVPYAWMAILSGILLGLLRMELHG